MLRCVECDCAAREADGWVAVLARDPEEDPVGEAACYCPVCAQRALGFVPRVSGYV